LIQDHRKARIMLLDVQNVTKRYPGADTARPVLQGVCLGLKAAETLALTGESGSGKSTLLHLVGALDSFDDGEIVLNGTPMSRLTDVERAALRRGPVALVFQQFNLIPSLTVVQNLSFHARLAGRENPRQIAELLDRLGLGGLENRFPEHLSGGQQQRVAIGRAIALRPLLLLADEPTGNLDETTSDTVLDLMLDLVHEAGTALFLVTHSQRIAARLDRQLHLKNGRIA
jgi:putative ABC transport system ATP-binding protein